MFKIWPVDFVFKSGFWFSALAVLYVFYDINLLYSPIKPDRDHCIIKIIIFFITYNIIFKVSVYLHYKVLFVLFWNNPFANIDIYKSSFFPRLLEIGILLQVLSIPLLKVQKILLLSLLHL